LIAFAQDETDIYVVRPNGTGLRRLTGIQASESQPAWSPDGRSIAYVRREPGSSVRELWLMRADGSGQRRLTSLRASSFFPAWSPDGRKLAFASNVAGRYYDIYALTVGTKGVRRLTRTGTDAFEPAWSPDGRTIAYSEGGAIQLIDADGKTKPDELTDSDDNDSSPAWNPRPPADEG
jgi:TolB protein